MKLYALQQWLGALISQPLQEDHLLPTQTPFGTEMEQEVAKYVAPSSTLEPFQRVQIYHQQYWWRLIKCLQTNFPTLHRLFGYTDFQNHIAVPYLTAYPPSDWALCALGASLPHWLQENYHADDSYLVHRAAEIDWAANHAFWVPEGKEVHFEEMTQEEIGRKSFILQPFIHLFKLQADFFTFREQFLKNEPEYYNVNQFPSITYGNFYFVLYRTRKNVVSWKQLSQAEFWMLCQFKKRNTIEKVCSELEDMGGPLLEEALSEMPLWFKQWTVLKWFQLSSS